jgi:hypothetical protein
MKTFRIESVDWSDEVDVDITIFETYQSQAQEAISLSLERWLKSDDDHAIGPLTAAYDAEVGKGPDTYVMHNKAVFENIGRLDMVELFEEVNE